MRHGVRDLRGPGCFLSECVSVSVSAAAERALCSAAKPVLEDALGLEVTDIPLVSFRVGTNGRTVHTTCFRATQQRPDLGHLQRRALGSLLPAAGHAGPGKSQRREGPPAL